MSGRAEWTEFEGRGKFSTLLDGLVSVEELRDAGGVIENPRFPSEKWLNTSIHAPFKPFYG